MIDKKNIQRARTVSRFEAGGTPALTYQASETTKQKYAAKNGLVYQNGQFFTVGSDGTQELKEVTDSDLQAFENQLALDKKTARDTMATNIGNTINAADKALFAGNPNVSNQSPLTQTANNLYNNAAGLVSQINPVAGAAMKAWGFASDAMTAAGLKTDQMTTADKLFDSTLLKPIGIINDIGAKKSDSFSADQSTIERVGASYGGTVSDINDATKYSNKSYGLFSNRARKRANATMDAARQQQNAMTRIANAASDQQELVNQMGDQAQQAYQYSLNGGFDMRYLRAKEGGKLPEEEFVPELLDIEKIIPGQFKEGGILDEIIDPSQGGIVEWKPEIVDVDKLKAGGRIEKTLDAPKIEETDQKNLIPEGALHKNKHHMDNADGLTQKGIPVVDDEHNQQAEIERNEIIFTREVTKKLEELCKIYYSNDSTNKEKDEAALDAGKLLTKEIMLNTDDRTGLIDTLQHGGKLEQDKPEYGEWLKSVPDNFKGDNYDLELAYKLVPFERMERWRKEILKDKPSENVSEWHLPSAWQTDENTYVFLKKGKTTKDNPELRYEFISYMTDPEFSKVWRMSFEPGENRWTYVRRKVLK